MTKTENIGIRISKETKPRLDAMAKDRHSSTSNFVVLILESYLNDPDAFEVLYRKNRNEISEDVF